VRWTYDQEVVGSTFGQVTNYPSNKLLA